MTLRVVEWSTGTVGRHAIAGIDAHPDLELVGVWVSDPAKVGKDAGELAGLGRDLGVLATDDRAALLALAPDAIVHTAMTDDRIFEAIDDLISFVEAGVNVVSSGPVVLQFPLGILDQKLLDRIAAAGAAGGASLHVNGIDPGFANDVLALSMTSLSQRIDEVRCLEIADYSTYYQPVVMRDIFGFGQPMDATPLLLLPGVLAMGWGSVVRQLAAGLGLALDEPLIERHERVAADRDYSTVSVEIPEGTMAALHFEVVGQVAGVDRIVLEHYTRTHPEQCPQWPSPVDGDGCYRITISGEPQMSVEFAHHGENGDHNVSGMIVTAMRLVNSVAAVVDARPGLVTALDLPLITGAGLVSR
ncbi:putative NAD(P)-binding dihydrodipicolinate reductase-like protein [Gordonia polyisoprenivorans VH2]|uniref:Diacylglycerol kinase n=2 Tax=Gordonia polyisoprenivorans TaxID=84595 RepID=A0A846WVF8_9ACTN|nr:diacylglycerol kinase [Gordonia polyisoprenivorans]AFA75091.1 putative NAD(P)-binding dihydrodipicolinate reductase-like protein [Gordonia polyisoprenivorans VH2]MBE7193160.1 diacylglycerol kinase [Gordonia polyisoprenivorans]NKY04633.1 diacylglycerol kinase [Gordonia polyisoprenivorans]OZC32037.1 diacylglycerol kinase [Gordonia polyisoprenivorans]WCB36578.1 diacylglycerol kinase [Gordonia polyisoprenivorans]